jgi:glycosyltransferase involved in cell wall biosynthesis
VKRYVLENYSKTPPEHLSVIHRGVDATDYFPAYRPDPEWLQIWQGENPQLVGKTLLTLPGRVTRWKGHDDFLIIMKELLANHPEVHGLIAGGAHPRKQAYWDELQEKTKQLQLENNLTFLGHRSDLREILAASDLVLSLSKDPEAFGRVSLEALALGKPVVAYHHGGVGEQMDALFPEGTIPPNDIAAATEKISTFLTATPDRPRTNETFRLDGMTGAVEVLYQELLTS